MRTDSVDSQAVCRQPDCLVVNRYIDCPQIRAERVPESCGQDSEDSQAVCRQLDCLVVHRHLDCPQIRPERVPESCGQDSEDSLAVCSQPNCLIVNRHTDNRLHVFGPGDHMLDIRSVNTYF